MNIEESSIGVAIKANAVPVESRHDADVLDNSKLRPSSFSEENTPGTNNCCSYTCRKDTSSVAHNPAIVTMNGEPNTKARLEERIDAGSLEITEAGHLRGLSDAQKIPWQCGKDAHHSVPKDDTTPRSENKPVDLDFRRRPVDTKHIRELPWEEKWTFEGHRSAKVLHINPKERNEDELSLINKRRLTQKSVEVKWSSSLQDFKNYNSDEQGLEILQVLRTNEALGGQSSVVEDYLGCKGCKEQEPAPSAWQHNIDDTFIQRVRIQSMTLLLVFSHLSESHPHWDLKSPMTFFRPFHAFYYFQPYMKSILRILSIQSEEKAQRNALNSNISEETTSSRPTHGHLYRELEEAHTVLYGPDEVHEILIIRAASAVEHLISGFQEHKKTLFPPQIALRYELPVKESVKHLRCYIDFVEEHIIPLYEHFTGISQTQVRFRDLGMSFQPGEILYSPTSSNQSELAHSVWRLVTMEYGGQYNQSYDIENGKDEEYRLWAYYIDFDGSTYGPVRRVFTIPSYEGLMDIRSLHIYPMRFVRNANELMEELQTQGRHFQSRLREKHAFYDGWTLTHISKDKSDIRHRNSERLVGDVVIDFLEGISSNRSLKPSFAYAPEDPGPFAPDAPSGVCYLKTTSIGRPIKCWADPSRAKLLGDLPECNRRENLSLYFADLHQAKSKFITEWQTRSVTQLYEDDCALLPHRFIAYALRERRFVLIDRQNVQPITPNNNAFRDLKIDDSHKRVVKSLVKAHFKRQSCSIKQPANDLNQDIIRGKGSGLIILLHGVPGVGKTATAESVAQAKRRPLYFITSGDLGITPREVELGLNETFRLAQLWGCVLLLDEADIFLSRRETSDLKRNALVSVFLRVLEYYNGILFLTTNRVGTLDEAFKSRVHLSLYYAPLDLDQTLAIFEIHIRKVRLLEEEKRKLEEESSGRPKPAMVIKGEEILGWAKRQFQKGGSRRWKGRQIRNAFQIATSLAEFDTEDTSVDDWNEDQPGLTETEDNDRAPKSNKVPVLSSREFKIVAKAIRQFNDYLSETIGEEEEVARLQGIRSDTYNHRAATSRPQDVSRQSAYSTRQHIPDIWRDEYHSSHHTRGEHGTYHQRDHHQMYQDQHHASPSLLPQKGSRPAPSISGRGSHQERTRVEEHHNSMSSNQETASHHGDARHDHWDSASGYHIEAGNRQSLKAEGYHYGERYGQIYGEEHYREPAHDEYSSEDSE